MARVSTAFTVLTLAIGTALLLIPRDGPPHLRASFESSGVDPMPTGSTSQAAKAKHARDTLAP